MGIFVVSLLRWSLSLSFFPLSHLSEIKTHHYFRTIVTSILRRKKTNERLAIEIDLIIKQRRQTDRF